RRILSPDSAQSDRQCRTEPVRVEPALRRLHQSSECDSVGRKQLRSDDGSWKLSSPTDGARQELHAASRTQGKPAVAGDPSRSAKAVRPASPDSRSGQQSGRNYQPAEQREEADRRSQQAPAQRRSRQNGARRRQETAAEDRSNSGRADPVKGQEFARRAELSH